MPSRRDLLTGVAGIGALAAAPDSTAGVDGGAPDAPRCGLQEALSLDGAWGFRPDPDGRGERERWFLADVRDDDWADVVVPHTWQVAPGLEEFRGAAWYRRRIHVPMEWASGVARLEFEAVFHSATVWINGAWAGRHLRLGYTPFVLDATALLRFGADNLVVVRVDSAFDERMLPRGRSSDWAHDGGIHRPVRLRVSAPVYIERIHVDAVPAITGPRTADQARVDLRVLVRNAGATPWSGTLVVRIAEPGNGADALRIPLPLERAISPGEWRQVNVEAGTILQPLLWHFDHPHLYRARATLLTEGCPVNSEETTFGIRTIEVQAGNLYLNGEKLRFMGVERMAGANPEFGMAEPECLIRHDHGELKHLNCVFSRVHWPPDRRVLENCDRQGILLQCEIPAWGWETFQAAGGPLLRDLLQNGLDQLNAMIEHNYNHPCIVAWGLANEINGHGAAETEFVQRLYAEAKRLDGRRLCAYASNSLQENPGADVSALMDLVQCNEYFGSWSEGTPEDLRRHLLDVHQAFPGKPVVISEFGYCACVPERPEGDAERIAILQEHVRVCRELDFVAGLIFFSYNDYRTHIGDTGEAALRQRIHGVVDLYGTRKPSFDVLRAESSPIEWLRVAGEPADCTVTVRTRATIPAYRLAGYSLRGLAYGAGEIPVERLERRLPVLEPGETAALRFTFATRSATRVVFDVLRPRGSSAYTHVQRSG